MIKAISLLKITKTTKNIEQKCPQVLRTDLATSPLRDCLITLSTNNPIIDIIGVNFVAKHRFLNHFLSNKPQIERIIQTADIEGFGQKGFPLKYSRQKFIKDLNQEMKKFSDNGKQEFYKKLKIEVKLDNKGNLVSYEGIPCLAALNSKNKLETPIIKILNKFINKNKIKTNDKALNGLMNSVIKAFPEWVNIIGKKQHNDELIETVKNQNYSVDVHIIKVLKEAMNHPDYKTLSDENKKVLKIAILFHDIAKKEGIIDAKHPYTSALYTGELMGKINQPPEIKKRIISMVLNHHWLKGFNTGEITPEDVAEMFKNSQDYTIAKIFANSDLKGVNEEIYQKLKDALSPKSQKPIQDELDIINKKE